MEAFDLIDEDDVRKEFTKAFKELDRMEIIQLLSDLGYIPDKAFDDGIIDPGERQEAIELFRAELKQVENAPKLSNIQQIILESEMISNEIQSSPELTRSEIYILKEITGLDEELVIKQIPEDQVSLLSRIFIYRYRIYDLLQDDVKAGHKFTSSIIKAIKSSITDIHDDPEDWLEFGNILADQQKLSNFCITSPKLNNRFDSNCIFISIDNQKGKELIQNLGDKIDQDKRFIRTLSNRKIKEYVRKLRDYEDREEVKGFVADKFKFPSNRFMRRLLQVKLWMTGLYQGTLDHDFGPLTITALNEFMMTVLEDEDKNGKKELGRIMYNLGTDQCIINIHYLLIEYFIPTENSEIPPDQTSVSQVFDFVLEDKAPVTTFSTQDQRKIKTDREKLTDSLRTELRTESKNVIDPKSRNLRKYKAKKGIAKFFQKVFKFVKNVFDKIKTLFKKLFRLIKKVAKIIYTEIKEAFQTFRDGLKFLFGNRVINPTSSITSDYDVDFDGITVIHSKPSAEDIQTHIDDLERYSSAIYPTLNFIKNVIKWGIRFATGGLGWMKILLAIAKIFKDIIRKKQFELAAA